jgi:hypothetical protein
LAVRLWNANSFTQTVAVSIECDINLNGLDRAPVWGIPGQRGFVVFPPTSHSREPSVIPRWSPTSRLTGSAYFLKSGLIIGPRSSLKI